MNVTLKDLSGTMSDTIHYKVLSSEVGYIKDIKVGSALILHNVFVFSPKSSNCALNITLKNLVKIFKKDTIMEDADGASVTVQSRDKAESYRGGERTGVEHAQVRRRNDIFLKSFHDEDLDKAKDITNLIKETQKHTRENYVYIAKVKLDRK
ncbi:copia protein [Tanacetum coccineum]